MQTTEKPQNTTAFVILWEIISTDEWQKYTDEWIIEGIVWSVWMMSTGE